jgi:hypothetical protein
MEEINKKLWPEIIRGRKEGIPNKKDYFFLSF